MDELVEFLRARLAEDERAARQATEGPWTAEVSGETGHCVIPSDAQSTREYVARTQLYAAAFDAEHIARHDPARVLREIEAKRRLLNEYTKVATNDVNEVEYAHGWANALGEAVRLLALPYADHPNYRKEWRPDGGQ
ncbi:hypothetical protein CFC35_05650 [Streptomyces sp. FBKL.4005]|nr:MULTISPECIES: DUF6221 family protein [Streptomyces]MCG0069713.1 DUF6221 family protein [Streptomyces tricolor]OYP14050.1 hypothetical protein CFC35_05650 [Streptomyces sp. FBKL.4005]